MKKDQELFERTMKDLLKLNNKQTATFIKVMFSVTAATLKDTFDRDHVESFLKLILDYADHLPIPNIINDNPIDELIKKRKEKKPLNAVQLLSKLMREIKQLDEEEAKQFSGLATVSMIAIMRGIYSKEYMTGFLRSELDEKTILPCV